MDTALALSLIISFIDVICALLNPVKVAKAVIRLFQCLYDLLLLLPQISVPVMFIQLILHLLKLLECVFDRVATIVTVINELINAIRTATEAGTWSSLQSLEEVLSEYLLDLNGDGKWDYIYNSVFGTISPYKEDKSSTFQFELIIILICLFLF